MHQHVIIDGFGIDAMIQLILIAMGFSIGFLWVYQILKRK